MALKTYLTGHGFRVDLTHVKSTVISLHHIDGHSPGIVTIVTNAHTRIVGHHVGMNGQNSFGIRAEPCNLVSSQVFDDTSELCWSACRHGDVFQGGDKAGFKTSHWKKTQMYRLHFCLYHFAEK